MSSFAPGQRIEARCTRCRDLTGHVIVVLVDGAVAKVECCACGSVHKYYPPEGKKREAASRPVRVQSGKDRDAVVKSESSKSARVAAPKPPTKAERERARVKHNQEQEWQDAIARNISVPVPYSIKGTFNAGTLIDHSSFGLGVVVSVLPPDKMEVLFEDGRKTLRCVC